MPSFPGLALNLFSSGMWFMGIPVLKVLHKNMLQLHRDIRKWLVNRPRLLELIRFGLVGALVTFVHYAVYWVLKPWIDYSVSFAVGYGLAFVLNYFLTSLFTFRRKTTWKNGVGFGGAHLFNFILQTVLLRLFVNCGIEENLAPVPVYMISIPVNFLMVRFVFKGRHFRLPRVLGVFAHRIRQLSLFELLS